MNDPLKAVLKLYLVRDSLGRLNLPSGARIVEQAIESFNALLADNARLAAEVEDRIAYADEVEKLYLKMRDERDEARRDVERRRPREMTAEEAVKVLNEERYEGFDRWSVDRSMPTPEIESPYWLMSEHAAVAVAEKLLREKEAKD